MAGGGDRLISETKYTKEQAQFLSKWYKVLFWLVIPGIAALVLSVLELVYLYRQAKLFESIAGQN